MVTQKIKSVFSTGNHIVWDDSYGSALAIDHLAGLGHREIAIIVGMFEDIESAENRIKSAHERAEEMGMTVHWIGQHQRNQKEDFQLLGQTLTRRILQEHPSTTAIICRQDYFALGIYSELRKAGLRIPEDMAVLGYLNLQDFLYFSPQLTSVQFPLAEGVSRAIELIFEDGIDSKTKELDLTKEIQLIPRASTTGD